MLLYEFYRSKEWTSFRKMLMLERVNETGDVICEHCHKAIINKYDCIAHHKIELTESNVNDLSISLNADNIMLVHHRCHNDIHNRFGSYTRKVYIVYGPPCAGKSSYVDSVAMKNDLIVDINKIYTAINNSRSNRVYGTVMTIYRQLIDIIKTRNGQWVNAYIVRGFPLISERERLARDLDAELIYIDVDKETCLARAENEDMKKYIDDWFEKFNPPV